MSVIRTMFVRREVLPNLVLSATDQYGDVMDNRQRVEMIVNHRCENNVSLDYLFSIHLLLE